MAVNAVATVSLGPTPKNRPGTHCLCMRIINTFNVGIPTFCYTFRVRSSDVTPYNTPVCFRTLYLCDGVFTT